MAITGIGMVNATASTATLLDNFEVEGVVFSGVAGTSFNIGDVIIADTWMIVDDMTTYVRTCSLESRAERAALSVVSKSMSSTVSTAAAG